MVLVQKTVSEPVVVQSFANCFWGKDDAGVPPLLQRMHDAKTTCDELKGFYTARAALEDEFARKLLGLSKRSLGSCEMGTLKQSMDTLRSEVESMAKAHQIIANQMKTECEEPLAAFAGALRERRKIVQGGIEKVLKLKTEQTLRVNKTRDRCEQDFMKIKGYEAQVHMVMGQEEKRIRSRLDKAKIAYTTSKAEYEGAIKELEVTTTRWNRDWKQACDKFQDLEEERIDFLKSSCWTFANISSTVCVSDDASCEKVRVSLEDCEVEKDVEHFIKERGTGSEIPDPPKYINFARGDSMDDSASETADENYHVAQFPRAGNPAYRSASPNPSSASSEASGPSEASSHVPVARSPTPERERAVLQKRDRRPDRRDRRKAIEDGSSPHGGEVIHGSASSMSRREQSQQQQIPSRSSRHDRQAVQNVPHNEYPLDGMTMYCRPGKMISDSSSDGTSPVPRQSSSDDRSDYTDPSSASSHGHPNQMITTPKGDDKQTKRKSFFGAGPFRRKSKSEKAQQQQQQQIAVHEQRRPERRQTDQNAAASRPSPSNRNTWGPAAARNNGARNGGPEYGSTGGRQRQSQFMLDGERRHSPEPLNPGTSLALNVGGNVFDVSQQDPEKPQQKPQEEEDLSMDPIAQALAELKNVTKNPVGRNSADRFFGLATPAPSATPGPSAIAVQAAQRGTPPPNYAPKASSALGLPPPAFTSAQMQQTTQRYINQREDLLQGNSPQQQPPAGRQRAKTIDYQRPQSRVEPSRDVSATRDRGRSPSPIPNRSVSPRPQLYGDAAYRGNSPQPDNSYNRARSPNPYTQSRPGTSQSSRPPGQYAAYNGSISGQEVALAHHSRGASPAPSHHSRNDSYNSRSRSRAGSVIDGYGSASNRNSMYSDQGGAMQMYQGGAQQQQVARPKSSAGNRQFSRDGRPILHYARAMYHYKAAIPEELGFQKGDILVVLKQQDDGWWEAEVVGVQGRPGLVPSNYLQTC